MSELTTEEQLRAKIDLLRQQNAQLEKHNQRHREIERDLRDRLLGRKKNPIEALQKEVGLLKRKKKELYDLVASRAKQMIKLEKDVAQLKRINDELTRQTTDQDLRQEVARLTRSNKVYREQASKLNLQLKQSTTVDSTKDQLQLIEELNRQAGGVVVGVANGEQRQVSFLIPDAIARRLEEFVEREMLTSLISTEQAWEQVCARVLLAGIAEVGRRGEDEPKEKDARKKLRSGMPSNFW